VAAGINRLDLDAGVLAPEIGGQAVDALGHRAAHGHRVVQAQRLRAGRQREGCGGSEAGKGEVHASGIRNSVGLEFNPKDKTLWFTDNQTDGLGDDIPLGEINRATQAGQFFGYPWKQGKTRIADEGYDKDPQVCMDAQAADLGLAFHTAKAFPAKHQSGSMLISDDFAGALYRVSDSAR
jgi:glucose/arabinose dehydrogenase